MSFTRWIRPALVCSLVLLVLPARAAQPTCGDCHEDDRDLFPTSVHGAFMECVDCHAGAAEVPHDPDALEVDCFACHEDTVAKYRGSVHGMASAAGESEAPDCQSCHGPIHALQPSTDPQSPVNHARLAETCGSCHADPEMVAKFGIPIARPLQAYEASVHNRVLLETGAGPSCNDCHGSHAIYGAEDPRSMVNHQRVPRTCGRCHGEIAAAYEGSVHGEAASHGVREAPVCTDCHGEHRILSPSEKSSPVYATNVPKLTCGRCHGDLRLAEKFGIESDRVPAYEDSYHGLASRAGKVTVAHCGSCHGVHDILPSSDPRSHTNPRNLASTCGQCHPGAGSTFAIGSVHVLPTEREHAAVYWVRVAYLWLIWLTVGGMLVHNGLDLRRKFRDPPPRLPSTSANDRPVRMARGFRIAHLMLLVSFGVLVYSGFALKYPGLSIFRPLFWLDGGSHDLRADVHRGAAILMLAALAIHLAHLAVDRTARRCIAGMRPTLEDVVEFRERIRWYLGRRPDPPHTPQLGYPEKLEYLALMWGILVMSVTGFMLWFDDLVLRWLPKWVTDVATAIHFYEAILASLAILVWHFYFVIFDPAVYPMDTAWLTGRAHPARDLERGIIHPAAEQPATPTHSSPRTGRPAATG